MDWVKLRTGYYLDAAIEEVGEAAEVLFVRALAWCGYQENGGFVPRKILPRLTPTRGAARARALVEHGLWIAVDGGWQITSWERYQTSRDQLDGKREAGRRRQATHRARHGKGLRNGVSDAVSNGVRDAEVTPREVEVEVEVEVEAAAAAAGDHTDPTSGPGLPTNVLILRQALEAHRLHVDWSRLSADQVDEIGALVDRHGENALIRSALAQYQPAKPAATAQAWLPAWRDLRAPGDLALVKPDPCPLPGHQGSVTRCAQCASEQKAAR